MNRGCIPYERPVFKINELIHRNIERFGKGIDIVDLKGLLEEEAYKDYGFGKQQWKQSANIYLLSERGYSKLLKILEDDRAWEIYDQLVDNYFTMRSQLTTEIKSYQSIGGQAIFEIGRRLKWVKENDLTHGEFGKWLDSIGMNQRVAQRFMKIAAEIPNTTLGSHLGWKVLYEIATMPESERDKSQRLDSGEVKKPDEMTDQEYKTVLEYRFRRNK